MPPVARVPRRDLIALAQEERVVVPERVARALKPSSRRDTIPDRVSVRHEALYAGELREEQTSPVSTSVLLPGRSLTLVTLRRPWIYVGFIINPGNAGVPEPPDVGLSVKLRILAGRLNGLTVQEFFVNNFIPGNKAFVNITVGAACELVAFNGLPVPIRGLQAAIWGMGVR